jgi:hypothetical protein
VDTLVFNKLILKKLLKHSTEKDLIEEWYPNYGVISHRVDSKMNLITKLIPSITYQQANCLIVHLYSVAEEMFTTKEVFRQCCSEGFSDEMVLIFNWEIFRFLKNGYKTQNWTSANYIECYNKLVKYLLDR